MTTCQKVKVATGDGEDPGKLGSVSVHIPHILAFIYVRLALVSFPYSASEKV